MSVPHTLGARQSTFTIDSTDVDASSRTFSGNGNIQIPIENNSPSSSDINLKLDKSLSSKSTAERAAKKHKLNSINNRLGGQNKRQSDIDNLQVGEATTTNSCSNSNTEASAQLSSSVRKRLRHIHRRKVDIGLVNQTADHTESAKGIAGHAELYRGEQTIPRAANNETATSGSNTTSIDTSKLRKTVSFITHPRTFIDKPTAQFGDNRISHQNSTKLTQNSYDINSQTDSTSSTQITYPRSVKSNPSGESQELSSQTGLPFHPSSILLHPVQLRHKARNQGVPDRTSSPTNAQISGISKTLTNQTYDRSKFKKQIRETHVQRYEPVIYDADILNSNVRFPNEQTNNEHVNRSLEFTRSKSVPQKAEKDKTIYNISGLHVSSDRKNLRSSDNINSDRNNQGTIITPVLEKVSYVSSTDLLPSDLVIFQGSGGTQQKLVHPFLDNSPPTKQQLAVIQLDNGCNGDHVLLENTEQLVNNSKKHNKQSKLKIDKTLAPTSAENIPRCTIQQTELENSTMARSGRVDYANESFQDVLTERNDMAKTERVYRMRIRQLEEELKQMVHQCQGLSNENKELRKTLDGMKASKDKFENMEVLAKVTKLESEKAKLVAEYNKKLQQLDSVMLDSAKIRTMNAELENKVKELEKQVEVSHSKMKSPESEKTRGLVAKIQELQATVKDLEYEKKAVVAKVKSLEYDNTSLTDSLESKRREIDYLTNSLQTRDIEEAYLKVLQDENHKIKEDLTEINKKLRNLEVSKQKLQDLLNEQDKILKQATFDNDEKDKIISKLRKNSELKVQEIKKLNESQQASRDKEKESLVSRIASLKAEIDGSLMENCKLKHDQEELAKINDQLRKDNIDLTEACKESKKYLRKWELEKEHRSKVEQDLDKMKEEVSLLETRSKEAEKTVSILKNKLKTEDEQDDLNNAVTNNPETNIKVLMDQNMKLRQMLVERNIQLTNTKHEQTVTHSRIQHLERKQNNAEVRVKQLSEYLGSVIYNTGQESSSEDTKIFPSPGKKIPTSPTHKNSSKQSPGKIREPSVKEIKIGGNEREQTTSCLPLLDTSPAPSPGPRNGYFSLYREKQKRVKDKGYM